MKGKKAKSKKTKMIVGIVLGLFFILGITFFGTAIHFGYAPDYLTKIVCKEQPYTDKEYYQVKEPYTDKEYYYEREPYTVCAGHSWWSGKCNEWKTEYRDIRKSRTITKYRTFTETRKVTKFAELCVRIYKWKSVDFSENWLEYPELYDREGRKRDLHYLLMEPEET